MKGEIIPAAWFVYEENLKGIPKDNVSNLGRNDKYIFFLPHTCLIRKNICSKKGLHSIIQTSLSILFFHEGSSGRGQLCTSFTSEPVCLFFQCDHIQETWATYLVREEETKGIYTFCVAHVVYSCLYFPLSSSMTLTLRVFRGPWDWTTVVLRWPCRVKCCRSFGAIIIQNCNFDEP